MTSERQFAANRSNALKSTGPVTERGKISSSRNATKHGILSTEDIVAGESADLYTAFREAMLEDLKPEGALEGLLVEKIVNYSWRLRRAIRAETSLFQVGLALPNEMKSLDHFFDGLDAAKLQNLSRYEAAISKGLYRALTELRRSQSSRKCNALATDPWSMMAFGFVS